LRLGTEWGKREGGSKWGGGTQKKEEPKGWRHVDKLAARGGEGGRNSGEVQSKKTETRQRRKRKGIFLGTCL
jgi:hypothetical protein